MSRPDLGTHTEADAGEYERMTSPSASRRELAEDAGYDRADDGLPAEHEPCITPGCLVCDVLPKALAEHRAEMDTDWWSE